MKKDSLLNAGKIIGAYLESSNSSDPLLDYEKFNQYYGKRHAFFSYYLKIDNLFNNSSVDNFDFWINNKLPKDALPLVFLEPHIGLESFLQLDSYTDLKSKLTRILQICLGYNKEVLLSFGHEMNGQWYVWGQDPDNYKQAFGDFCNLKNSINASNVKMCWIPNQCWGYPNFGTNGSRRPDDTEDMAYEQYYPGDEYVDWVGLNYYCRNSADVVKPMQFAYGIGYNASNDKVNFYKSYALNKSKKMLIGETSFFEDGHNQEQLNYYKKVWLTQIYDADFLNSKFPLLKLIVWFDVLKFENGIDHNFQLPRDSFYKDIIHNVYF